MTTMNRVLLVVFSLFMAMIFAVPNLAIFIVILLSLIAKQISLIFCLLFAWHVAKLVEYFYKKSQEK